MSKYFRYIKLPTITLLLVVSQVWLASAALASSPNVVISEVAPDGSNTSQEFIELYNNISQDVSLEGWKIQIKSASGTVSRNLTLSNTLRSHSYALLASTGYSAICADADFDCFSSAMSSSGGHVVLLDNNNSVIDRLGWGNANDPEEVSAPALALGLSSLTRKAANTTVLQDTDRNSADFTISSHTPMGGGVYDPSVDVCLNIDGVQLEVPEGFQQLSGNCQANPNPISQPQPAVSPICQDILINEILPNPDGEDTNNEFIELYNNSDSAVNLTGCSLKIGSSQQTLAGNIEPRGYRVFYSLTLPNAAGGKVELISSSNVVSVTYPGGLGNDESYGLIFGSWRAGLVPTPGSTNTAQAADAPSTTTSSSEPESCPPGKFRNPDTNRCRNIGTTTASLAPCGPGETRNPETNRCRKIATTSTGLSPCQTGYQRNPDTNRCRKVAAAKTTNPMSTTSKSSKTVSYLVLVAVAVLGVAYALYEYRQSIYNYFLKRKRAT